MRKNIYVILSVIVLFTACNEDMETLSGSVALDVIATTEAFESIDGTATRASENNYKTEFTNGDQIGITVIKDGKIVDGVNNICFTYDALTAKWTAAAGSPSLYYYPDATYLAYYPYDATMSNKMTEQAIIDAFTPQTDQSAYTNYTKSDLMTGTGTVVVTNGKPVVTFQFAHRMSLLVIYPRGQHYQTSDGYDFYAPLKDITTLKVGTMTAIYQPGDCTFRAIVPPGTVDVTIDYVTTEDVAYNYTGTATTTTGKFSKMQLTPAGPALPYAISVGDYFFADGGLLPATAVLAEVNKKNCIGLVFHSGKHSTDSGTYTDKSGAPMDVHGYVIVAAPNIYRCAWGSQETDIPNGVGTSQNISDFMGYDNTQIIKAKALSKHPELAATSGLSTEAADNYPATYRVTISFEQDCPSPVRCSGWFLPSFGQLSVVYSQKDKLTENLVKLGRNNLFNDRYTWTSTEYMLPGLHQGKHAYGCNLSNNRSNLAGKGADGYSPIAVLAF